jgi:hypothetical protein
MCQVEVNFNFCLNEKDNLGPKTTGKKSYYMSRLWKGCWGHLNNPKHLKNQPW